MPKFLLDQNLSSRTTELFRELGKGGAPDKEIYELARSQERILVTFDLDFAREFMFRKDLPDLITLRIHPQTLGVLNPVLRGKVDPADLDGTIVTVETDRYRIKRVRPRANK